MTIKSDRWIRRMAREHAMIAPFVESQVRAGVISYGLSSYGYDMRIADEFKVFTNVFNTLVDPKHFDPRSFVDIKGAYCDIPPNSFVLARSVEYFQIPRNVLCVCLGKSTYARCFRGDTRVALLDGTAPTLEELARRAEQGDVAWGYSVGPRGRIIATRLEQPRYIGRDALVEITLDHGASLCCTPDHAFMLRDGRMVCAGDLRPGTSLMPLYRRPWRGHDYVYQPSDGHYSATHRLTDAWNTRHSIDAAALGTSRPPSERDRNRHAPWNRSRIRADTPARMRARGLNHSVSSVTEHAGTHDVFCVSVPEAGNFALEAGVFVHNCGIIVNTTPFEPGWRGYVTIELSNSTPLPARIYANEGIGQVLFFESDEPCEVSYDEKQGKYLDQIGVVPPRL